MTEIKARIEGAAETSSRTLPKSDASAGGAGIRVKELTVELGGRVVLDDLSVDVERGEFITVLGNSGCGKTTFLRYIAGFVPAVRGTVRIADRDVTDMPPHQRNIGLLYQNYALFPHMTVFENVAFGLRARKIREDEIRGRVAASLRVVRMEDFAGYRPVQLSGGMQQRIALARALVIEPDVLLLDEPLSALDANLRAAVRTELKTLHETMPGLTIVYVTHDREDALMLSDRVLLLKEGRVAQIGTPQDLYDRPHDRFVASYLGLANFLPVSVVDRAMGDLVPSEADALTTYCIRPESFRIGGPGAGRLSGEVVRSEWHGSSTQLAVAVPEAGPEPIVVEIARRGIGPRIGERVVLSFAREDCVLVRG